MATDKIKYRLVLIILCAAISGCFSRPSMMTHSAFDQVQVGSPIADLKAQIGQPYAVHHKDSGDEYEYVERINVGNSRFAENHYFLIVQDGKVVGKYMKQEQPPAYDLIYQDEPNYPGYTP